MSIHVSTCATMCRALSLSAHEAYHFLFYVNVCKNMCRTLSLSPHVIYHLCLYCQSVVVHTWFPSTHSTSNFLVYVYHIYTTSSGMPVHNTEASDASSFRSFLTLSCIGSTTFQHSLSADGWRKRSTDRSSDARHIYKNMVKDQTKNETNKLKNWCKSYWPHWTFQHL